eukprot:GGOE01001597.1.p1 GENE.GGOE01001597.1~~GGOE01001597.1.p1  ORF type:complete len:559 (+),score=140.68 GGOE01001597.1:26-1702(+)
MRRLWLPLLLCAWACGLGRGCTVLMAARGATLDGSLLTSHTNDGDGKTDGRLFRVPAMDHPPNAQRPIYPAPEEYPRLVLSDGSRGRGNYVPEPGQTETKPLGQIPQVNHTYALFEATYGIVNEHGLAIGESTCSSVNWAKLGYTKPASPMAIMSIDELSRIAMERCKTAREAVATMGHLAEQYGFFGPDSFEGVGESLMVVDPQEAWVFHILNDPTHSTAIWAAQRVPDDHVVVVANMFIIRTITPGDDVNFLYSGNLFTIAESHKLWTPGTPFDFTQVYSDGEYAHKYYTGRRMWGAAHLLAPSLHLPAEYGNLRTDAPYPFSFKPDRPVAPTDFFRVLRDWYAGTPYDLTKGLAAGPFGSPNRYAAGAGESLVKGNWERSITLARTTYSFVVEVSAAAPAHARAVLWFGPHAAHGTCYIPIPCGALEVPQPYRIARQGVLDRGSAFWAFRYVENLANLKFSYTIPHIKSAQQMFEKQGALLVESWRSSRINVTSSMSAHALKVLSAWWSLGDALMVQYADGYITTPAGGQDSFTPTGYPAWWLTAVGYENGPPPP